MDERREDRQIGCEKKAGYELNEKRKAGYQSSERWQVMS